VARLTNVAVSTRIIKDWQQSILAGRDPRRQRPALDRAADLMLDIARGSGDTGELNGGLEEFGRECGTAGLSLSDASELVASMNRCAKRRVRRQLDSHGAALSVAKGWMVGREHWTSSHAPTGYVGIDTLRLRIEQQFRQCHALGVTLGSSHVLAAFELDPFSCRELVLRGSDLAETIGPLFTSGETVAACENGRVLVFTALTPLTAAKTAEIRRHIEQVLGLAAGSVRVWIEPLAFEILHLASHLDELSS
jgi:hypothetical protein